MFEATELLKMHQHTHEGLTKLLEHCQVLSPEELRQELTSSGYPTVQLLLHHLIECEHYWIDVAADCYSPDAEYAIDDITRFPDVASLERYNDQVRQATADWLGSVTPEQLNTPREHVVWGGERRMLLPAGIVLRVITHHFHHRGQLRTMCRLLGHPAPDADYPVVP